MTHGLGYLGNSSVNNDSNPFPFGSSSSPSTMDVNNVSDIVPYAGGGNSLQSYANAYGGSMMGGSRRRRRRCKSMRGGSRRRRRRCKSMRRRHRRHH